MGEFIAIEVVKMVRITSVITVLAVLLLAGSADAIIIMDDSVVSTAVLNQSDIFTSAILSDDYIAARTVGPHAAGDELQGRLYTSRIGNDGKKESSSYFFEDSYFVSDNTDKTGKSKVIIQFYEEPVLSYAVKLKAEHRQNKNDAESKIKEYKDNIFDTHSNAKKQIEQNNIEIKYSQEYYGVFNGFAVEVSKKDIVKLRKISSIKAVYPDQKVYASLTESVPLINATSVWEMLDINGSNITGKNVKVAIIDTGVDYTHPDLGGGFGSSYKVIAGWDFYNNDPDPIDDHAMEPM